MPNWEAGNELQSNGSFKLWIKSRDADVVRPPQLVVQHTNSGDIYENRFPFVDLFPKDGSSIDRGRWECYYPSDFRDAPDTTPVGHHGVRWFVGGSRRGPLIRVDEFDAPMGEGGSTSGLTVPGVAHADVGSGGDGHGNEHLGLGIELQRARRADAPGRRQQFAHTLLISNTGHAGHFYAHGWWVDNEGNRIDVGTQWQYVWGTPSNGAGMLFMEQGKAKLLYVCVTQ